MKKYLWIQIIGCMIVIGGAMLKYGDIFDVWDALGMVSAGMLIAFIGKWLEEKGKNE